MGTFPTEVKFLIKNINFTNVKPGRGCQEVESLRSNPPYNFVLFPKVLHVPSLRSDRQPGRVELGFEGQFKFVDWFNPNGARKANGRDCQ